jgi:hypothetical protein
MVDTIKFSQMTSGGDIANNDTTPGLQSGANVLFNNPWTFLPPGTTAERPTPSSTVNFRLRFNTDDQLYEYYDTALGAWTQLESSVFTTGPFITYTADISLPDAQNLGALSNGILKQTISSGVATLDIAVIDTDYYGPGMAGYIQAPAGIKDANGNIVVAFLAQTNAVNYLTITNNITGAFGATLSVDGPDNDIGLVLENKGLGQLTIRSENPSPVAFYSGTNLQHITVFTMANTAAERFVTWQDSDGVVAFLGDIPAPPGGETLTTVSDANVTITPSGNYLTALVNTATITMGWTGQLSLDRGGTNKALTASAGGIVWTDSDSMEILAGTATANLPLLSGSSATPSWGSFPLLLGGALTTAGPLTTSGAFDATFTFTNTTSVTFPTSGTLATTSQLLISPLTTKGDLWGWSTTNERLPVGTIDGQILQVSAAASLGLAYSTATYPSTAGTSGNFIKSDGTNFVSTAGSALTKTDDTNVTLTLGGSASTSLVNAASLTLGWTGTLAIARGGTGVSTPTTAPSSSNFAAWGTGATMRASNFVANYTTTVTAAGTTTLSVSSAYNQYFTGTSTQTVILPVASTLLTATSYRIVNNSSGTVTVQSSGLNTVVVLPSGNYAIILCILNSGTDASSWSVFTGPLTALATPVSLANGGTNKALTASAGGIVWTDADSMEILAGTATANQVLLSGANATPAWSTATYPPTTTASQLLYSSANNTVTGLATANNAILATNGSGVPSLTTTLPSGIAIKSVNLQIFNAGTSQTYTPTSNMAYAIVELVGGGGGAGGTTGSGGGTFSTSGGGAGGGYCRKFYTAAQMGASAALNVGSFGSGGTAGNNNGTAGGDSDFTPAGAGASLFAPGGTAGTGAASSSTLTTSGSAIANTPTGGDLNIPGQDGGAGAITDTSAGIFLLASGGSSPLGTGAPMLVKAFGNSYTGHDGLGYGGGGGGAGSQVTSRAGGNGSDGVCLVWEFIA